MTDHREPGTDDLACIELAEVCEGCRAALDQFQTVIRLAGRLTAADVARIDALDRDRLMVTLRAARRR